MGLYIANNKIDGGLVDNLTDDLKKSVFDDVYPINSIYISWNTTVPQIELSSGEYYGTWTILEEGRFLMSASSSLDTTGGEDTVVLTESTMPSHKHARNNMNLTGTLYGALYTASVNRQWVQQSGLFSSSGNTGSYYSGTKNGIYYDGETTCSALTFDSSKGSRSGALGEIGSGTAHENRPPYIKVAMYKRTA